MCIRDRKILDEGYEYAVGIDLERFFDTVNQSYLIELLSHTIKDGRVISPVSYTHLDVYKRQMLSEPTLAASFFSALVVKASSCVGAAISHC